MYGIPYEKITFQSELTPSEIVAKLKIVTSRFPWHKPRPEFIGSIFTGGFRIHHNIRNRNSYLPFLIGKIHANNEGSEIVVIMYAHPLIVLLMLGLFVYVFRIVLTPNFDIGLKILISLMAIFLHFGMYSMGFDSEVSFAKERLQKLFTNM